MASPRVADTVPRDFYKHEVDFAALGLQFPDFAKKLKPNGQLDFSDPESVRQLTKSLLRRDFDLEIDLPEDRLCPPVPNRYNYILWIQDLLDSTREDFGHGYDPDQEVIGVDIGTGASCIYPLLGCRARPTWKFFATEIDTKSLEFAKRNILTNDLNRRIRPISTQSAHPLLPPLLLSSLPESVTIDFTMQNPPFYSSQSDLLASAASKSRPPNSSCTGSPIEMIYPPPGSPSPSDPDGSNGGELSFTLRLLSQSLTEPFRTRIHWFTSMLGKLSSVSALLSHLHTAGCTNYAVTDFVQGSKTRRWAVAWSFHALRPSNAVARRTAAIPRALLPKPTEFDFSSPSSSSSDAVERVNIALASLADTGLVWTYTAATGTGLVKAPGNVWGRRARRAATTAAKTQSSSSRSAGQDEDSEAFVCRVSFHSAGTAGAAATQVRARARLRVHVRWLKGEEHVIFESFCEMLRRRSERSG